jgi:hypothetical protein
MIHTGLQAVDISRLEVNQTTEPQSDKDSFKDLQVDPPIVRKRKGKKGKRCTAGDGKRPLNKAQRIQGCSICGEPGHNWKTCAQLIILEGTVQGIGIE